MKGNFENVLEGILLLHRRRRLYSRWKNEVIFDDYYDALNFEYSLEEELTLSGQHVNYNVVLSKVD